MVVVPSRRGAGASADARICAKGAARPRKPPGARSLPDGVHRESDSGGLRARGAILGLWSRRPVRPTGSRSARRTPSASASPACCVTLRPRAASPLEELSERLELAWAARTQPELDTVVEDLPDRDAALTDTRPAKAARWIVAVIGNDERSGRWRPGEDTRALALIGDCSLDLRRADVEGRELRITAIAVIGDVRVIVPPGVAVELEGISLLGDKRFRVGAVPAPPPGAPRVRVTAYAVVGDVTVMSEPLSAPLTVSGPRWNV
jgi:hypothetical protein